MNKRVALIGENSIAYVDTLIAIWNSGECAVLIDWRIPYRTAVEMMEEAGVKNCYIEKEILDKYDICNTNIRFQYYEKKSKSAELLPPEVYHEFKENYDHREAIILFSSGTTGKAKGIILSHYAININADAIIDYMKLEPEDGIYIVKTLSHSSTLTGELLVGLKTKTRMVIAPTIVLPRFTYANIKKYNSTILCLNPTLLYRYADELKRGTSLPSSLKTIYVSGSILSYEVHQAAKEVFKGIPVYNVYGISEAGPRVAAQTEYACHGNSVGKSIKDVEIKVTDSSGSEVARGKKGIIHVHTKSKFSGYITKREKLTSLYKDWLNTGDIGYIDEYGELHIVGRSDELIIRNARKIYPEDIDRIIRQVEYVTGSITFGIPDGKGNEKIICCYATSNRCPVDGKTLLNACQSKLSMSEIPDEFVYMDKLIETANGKIDVASIKHEYGNREGA